MRTDEFSTERLSRRIEGIVGPVQSVLRRERGEDYDERLIADSLRKCVANMLDRLEESMLEMFTTPERREVQELTAIVEQRRAVSSAAVQGDGVGHLAP